MLWIFVCRLLTRCIQKKGGSAKKKSVKSYHVQEHKKESHKRRRGRPKKTKQVQRINSKENDPGCENEIGHSNITETSSKRLCSFSDQSKDDSEDLLNKHINDKDVHCWKNQFVLKESTITPSESKNEEFLQAKNSFDSTPVSKYCITQEMPITNISDPFKNIPQTKESEVSVLSDITNVTSRVQYAPSIPKAEISNMSQVWQNGKKPQTLFINNSFKQNYSVTRPKIHKWEMQALVDENQHVLLKISEPQKKSDTPDNSSLKICYFKWKSSDKKVNSEEKFPEEKKLLYPSKRVSNNSLMKIGEPEPYKSKYLYLTDCEITDEYLELRKAYFQHYGERLPKICSSS